MAQAPQFIVTFRGFEIGRYETAERAMAAARSVIDTELGAQLGRGELASASLPIELPRIEWQPPPIPFPFDASGYWHWRAQALKSERRPPTAPRPVPPRGRDEPAPPPVAYSGPPPRSDPPAATVITPMSDYSGPSRLPEDRQWSSNGDG